MDQRLLESTFFFEDFVELSPSMVFGFKKLLRNFFEELRLESSSF